MMIISRMCTNGQWVKWSTEFVDKCSDENVIFTVAHEISHIFKHCEPIKDDGQPVNGDVQNMAMDYVINAMLIDVRIGKMPTVACMSRSMLGRHG